MKNGLLKEARRAPLFPYKEGRAAAFEDAVLQGRSSLLFAAP